MASAGGGRPRQSHRPRGASYAERVLLASLSASVAETVTFPIDTVKTTLQLHGHPTGATPASGRAYRVALDIWKREGGGGVLGFYRGLPPAVLRHLFYTPTRIMGYEHMRESGIAGSASDSLLVKAVCGGVSGVIAQIVASPSDLIKVRMQADGVLLSQGLQPRYAGIVDALRKIVRMEGIKGLWTGVLPNAQRAFLVNMGELACYDHVKRFIINKHISEDNVYAHTLSSIASGFSATILSCPADVVKTRMMNQDTSKEIEKLYRNSYDCLVKTVRYEGIMALWKGFFPTWARLGPWQFVFWVSYEKIRYLAGLSSF